MKKENFLKERILQILRDACLVSTIHAIPNIIRTNRILIKLMWSICLLVSIGYCFFLVFQSISNYFEYEVVTKISVVHEIPTLFPAVSICNSNSFLTNYSFEYAKKILEKNKIPFNLDHPHINFLSTSQKLFFAKYFIGVNSLNEILPNEHRLKMGLNQSNLFISCMFNSMQCRPDDFEWYFDPLLGNCFRFNSGKYSPIKTLTRPGYLNGLQFELYLGEPESDFSYAFQSGAIIFVHNQSITPHFSEGMNLPVGMASNIAISREFIYKYEQPYSECVRDILDRSFNSELYKKIIESANKSYRRKDCYDLCFQKYLIKKCKCQEMSFLKYSNITGCFNLEDFLCSFASYGEFYSKNVKEICDLYCPLECDSVSYSLKSTFTDYPAPVYAKILLNDSNIVQRFEGKKLNFEILKRNILSANIYYDELKYTSIREMVKTSESDLVAIVGGILGLFLGISFLSFIEVVEVFLDIYFVILDYYSNMTKITNNVKI